MADISNKTFNIEEISIQELVGLSLPPAPIFPAQPSFQLDIPPTFDGKSKLYYSEDDVAFYNVNSNRYQNNKILDPIRKDSNSNIIYDMVNNRIMKKDELAIVQLQPKISVEVLSNSCKTFEQDNFLRFEQLIQIKADQTHLDFLGGNWLYDNTKWLEYVKTIGTGSFFSYGFKKDIPYNRDDYKDKNIDVEIYVDLKPRYNYLDEVYEEQFSQVSDVSLPNVYVAIDMIDYLNRGSELEEKLKKSNEFTSAKAPPSRNKRDSIKPKSSIVTSPGARIDSARFSDKTVGMFDFKTQAAFNQNFSWNNKFLNKIIFSRKEFQEYMSKAEKYVTTYPINVEVVISSRTENQILETIFDKVDLTQYIPQNYDLNNDVQNASVIELGIEKNDKLGTEKIKTFERTQIKMIPFFQTIQTTEFVEDETFFGEKQDLTKTAGIINTLIAQRFADEHLRHTRDFSAILNSVPCYSEALVYKISKFTKSGEKIQDVYIPALSDTELKYLDTQVKYDIDYVYKIFVYSLVYVECYTYIPYVEPEMPSIIPDDPNRFSFNNEIIITGHGQGGRIQTKSGNESSPVPVQQEVPIIPGEFYLKVLIEPIPVIVETLYYEEEVFIIDSPPVHPFADFYNYSNSESKVLINFMQNSGEYEKEFFAFNHNEAQKLRRIKKFQRKGLNDKILYKSDDLIKAIQMFRIDIPPQTYFDFKKDLKISLETTTSFIDNILSNKKYYYMFRSLDYHNHFSDPSPIYEIKLQILNGSSFLNVKIYKPEKIEAPIKTFRRFLYLDGAFEQTMINFEKSGLKYISPGDEESTGKTAKELDATPALGSGDSDKSIFEPGKKFKIKINSINSGKQFSVLLNFNTNHIK